MNATNTLVDEQVLSTNTNQELFDEHEVLHKLKHHLPAQAPLKDFIHHNTLHAFQKHKFYDGLRMASEIFGYRVSLSLREYRTLYEANQIRKDILEKVIVEKQGEANAAEWMKKVLYDDYKNSNPQRIGTLRSNWKEIIKSIWIHLCIQHCSAFYAVTSTRAFPFGDSRFATRDFLQLFVKWKKQVSRVFSERKEQETSC